MAEQLPLITKYRPADWDEMFGHEQALAGLRAAMRGQSTPHAYIITGPSGIGKTTLGRIIGKELKAEINEIDAASNNGVDAVREMIDFSSHLAFSGSGRRIFIIDECHMLTRNAWNALLKLLEEPPSHLYLALCTTEIGKVIETVLTRCFQVVLRPLSAKQMDEYLTVIAELEGWHPTPDILDMVVDAATGQPRKGLSYLQSVHAVTSRDEAARVIQKVDASEPLIELCQHLVMEKRSWSIVSELIRKVDDGPGFDEALIPMGRYITTVLLKEAREERARVLWQMLEATVFPAETYDKRTAFIAAVGRIMFGG